MKLWTHHPSSFRLDETELRIDPTKGDYWKKTEPSFRYRAILPMLQERLESDQLLWCCTERGRYMPCSEPSDLVEWEIQLPLSQVTLISVPAWEDLVWSRSDDWDSLFLAGLGEEDAASKDISALVRLPLPNGCMTGHGQLPARYTAANKPNPEFRRYFERIGVNYFDRMAGR